MLRPSASATRLFDSRKRHEVSWSSERKGGLLLQASIPRHTGTRIDHLNHTSTIMASLVTASTLAPFSTGVSLRGLRSKRTNTAPSAMAGGLRISPSRKGRRLQRQCRAVASRPDAPGQNIDDVLQQLESNVIELGPGENRARRNPRRPQPPTLLSAKYEKRPGSVSRGIAASARPYFPSVPESVATPRLRSHLTRRHATIPRRFPRQVRRVPDDEDREA